ncbi:MAG: hypothetical protein WCG86_04505 [Actinomycetota bacterium]
MRDSSPAPRLRARLRRGLLLVSLGVLASTGLSACGSSSSYAAGWNVVAQAMNSRHENILWSSGYLPDCNTATIPASDSASDWRKGCNDATSYALDNYFNLGSETTGGLPAGMVTK